jgi:hypothetical protein
MLKYNVIVLNIHVLTEDKIGDMKGSFDVELECIVDKVPKYHMKILINLNAKLGTKDIFKPTVGNENSHEISNDNGVIVVNFATSKNLIVRSTMFPLHDIYKFTRTL